MKEEKATMLPKIAILGGTGKEGPGLALRWASTGYSIIIGSREAEKAERVAAELNEQLGIGSITGLPNHLAAREADICVLTVVYNAHDAILESLKDDLRGKILVDTTARIDFRQPSPPAPPSAARMAQEILGTEVKVVAAFQNVPAHSLRKNLGQSLDSQVLVCSDDIQAAETVIQISETGGMKAYYAGNLDNAIVVEGITAILISLNKYHGVKTAAIGIIGIEG